jgi:hypothetical protein
LPNFLDGKYGGILSCNPFFSAFAWDPTDSWTLKTLVPEALHTRNVACLLGEKGALDLSVTVGA